ncbi:T-complex protein 1, beta subunit, partial [Reticulomyxa filosa]
MQKLHPQTIIRGWRLAIDVAIKALEESTIDNSKDPELFRKDLVNVAKTTLSSKIVVGDIDFFANLCVDAVLRLHDKTDLEMITVIKKPGGAMRDSYLDDGFILDKHFGLGQKTRWEKVF